MVTWSYEAMLVTNMKIAFPVSVLENNQGCPGLYSLVKALKTLTRYIQTTNSVIGPLGRLLIVFHTKYYIRFTDIPYDALAPTPSVPTHTDGMCICLQGQEKYQ